MVTEKLPGRGMERKGMDERLRMETGGKKDRQAHGNRDTEKGKEGRQDDGKQGKNASRQRSTNNKANRQY